MSQGIAEVEHEKLVAYFNGEGYIRYGLDGDVAGMSPAEIAIEVMREFTLHPDKAQGERCIPGEVLAELRALSTKASPGEWLSLCYVGIDIDDARPGIRFVSEGNYNIADEVPEDDAAFIVACVNAIRTLLSGTAYPEDRT